MSLTAESLRPSSESPLKERGRTGFYKPGFYTLPNKGEVFQRADRLARAWTTHVVVVPQPEREYAEDLYPQADDPRSSFDNLIICTESTGIDPEVQTNFWILGKTLAVKDVDDKKSPVVLYVAEMEMSAIQEMMVKDLRFKPNNWRKQPFHQVSSSPIRF